MKEIKKEKKRNKLEGGCWAQFCGVCCNSKAHQHSSHVDFSRLATHALTREHGSSSPLATGSWPEATWRAEIWSIWWSSYLEIYWNMHKKIIIRILGDLGFEPRSQWTSHSRFHHWATLHLCNNNKQQIIYIKQTPMPEKK